MLRTRILLGALAFLAATTASAADFRIVAYVAGWSMPAEVDASRLTHVNFAFATIDRDGRAGFRDASLGVALDTLVALKRQNPRLRVLVSVGGWGADGFSDAAFSEAARATFADSVVTLIRAHGADGVDLDWEYPGQDVAGIRARPEDKANFTQLLRVVRERLDAAGTEAGRPERYLLTIASADREYFDHVEMDRLHESLDWINVMAYDFFNSLTPTTGHHAGLYASQWSAPGDRTADASVRQHLAAGVPPEKLVLGVAFYGRGFEGVAPAHRGVRQPYERFEGEHPYAELAASLIDRAGYRRYWDEQAMAPYLWNEATRTFISYDDPQSIAAKADYVRRMGLGGMMFWELGQDANGALLGAIANVLAPAVAGR